MSVECGARRRGSRVRPAGMVTHRAVIGRTNYEVDIVT